MYAEEKLEGAVGARLRVSHPDEGSYLRRDIHLSLDGREFATLKSGRDVVIEIEPGRHSLRAHNTFLPRTVEFEAQPGEQLHFKVWNRKGFGSWMVELLGSGPLYLVIKRAADNDAASDARA